MQAESGSSRPIEFWFDFSSAYAYFAAQEIDDLGERVIRPVLWRPYMLGTAYKITGMRGLSSTPMKSDYARRDWARIARAHKVDFKLPSHHPSIALPATRVFYWIERQNQEKAVSFAKKIFNAYYVDGIDTANLDQVATVAERAGFDRAAVIAGANNADIKAYTKAVAESAITRGVFGSPFFIVDDEPFWGADRMEMMERWILDGGW